MADTQRRPTDPSRQNPQNPKREDESLDPSRRGQGREESERSGTERSGSQRDRSGMSERERSGSGSGGSRNRPEGDVEGIGNR